MKSRVYLLSYQWDTWPRHLSFIWSYILFMLLKRHPLSKVHTTVKCINCLVLFNPLEILQSCTKPYIYLAVFKAQHYIWQWLSTRLWYLQCISTGDTTVLHWATHSIFPPPAAWFHPHDQNPLNPIWPMTCPPPNPPNLSNTVHRWYILWPWPFIFWWQPYELPPNPVLMTSTAMVTHRWPYLWRRWCVQCSSHGARGWRLGPICWTEETTSGTTPVCTAEAHETDLQQNTIRQHTNHKCHIQLICHDSNVTWASWHLKSPATLSHWLGAVPRISPAKVCSTASSI